MKTHGSFDLGTNLLDWVVDPGIGVSPVLLNQTKCLSGTADRPT